jgi:excinuclease ABC subunit A
MKNETPSGAIVIRGARQNNPKDLGLEIPLNRLVGVTAVSGSGESSLVFGTPYAEGQRARNMTPCRETYPFAHLRSRSGSNGRLGPPVKHEEASPNGTTLSETGTRSMG